MFREELHKFDLYASEEPFVPDQTAQSAEMTQYDVDNTSRGRNHSSEISAEEVMSAFKPDDGQSSRVNVADHSAAASQKEPEARLAVFNPIKIG